MRLEKPFHFLTVLEKNELRTLQDMLSSIPQALWNADADRDQFKSHKQTQSIVFKFCSNDCFSDAYEKEHYHRYKNDFEPVLNRLMQLRLGRPTQFSRILLARLDQGKEVLAHRDWEPVHHYTHRLHIPIQTNTDAMVTVAGESRHLPHGHIFEISNKDLHSAVNKGSSPRVHLIFDIVDPLYAAI